MFVTPWIKRGYSNIIHGIPAISEEIIVTLYTMPDFSAYHCQKYQNGDNDDKTHWKKFRIEWKPFIL